MRKIGIIAFILMLLLTACSPSNDVVNNNDTNTNDDTDTKDDEVDIVKPPLIVEVTLPKIFFADEDMNTVIKEAETAGITEVIKNTDGSITYKMQKSEHQQMLADIEEDIMESMKEMIASEDLSSIKDITYNRSFTEFILIVDQEVFEDSLDKEITLELGMSGIFYQYFSSINAENTKINILFKDEETNDVFDEVVYPDVLEDEAAEKSVDETVDKVEDGAVIK